RTQSHRRRRPDLGDARRGSEDDRPFDRRDVTRKEQGSPRVATRDRSGPAEGPGHPTGGASPAGRRLQVLAIAHASLGSAHAKTMGMARLQRPPTLKEIVMRSLLQWREPADTLVDDEIDARTTEV